MDNNWSNTGIEPKFFGASYYAVFPFVIMLLHISFNTFLIFLISFIFFLYLESKKIKIRDAHKRVIVYLLPKHRRINVK